MMLCPACGGECSPEHTECPKCQNELVASPLDDAVDDEFVQIARFDTRLEAETIGHALDQYDILFLVKSDDIGIFGPGHVMSTPQGASLWVPASRREEVSDLLSCVISRDDADGEN